MAKSLRKDTSSRRSRESHRFETIPFPNLVDVQLQSYEWFLKKGLRELFDHFSPIEDFTGTLSLEFLDYYLGEPKFDHIECRDRDMTYEMPLKVKVRLVNKETGELSESEVYMGELPCMTDRGTFIVNGAERVVVSQLARSPGVFFSESIDFSGRELFVSQIIPREGAWVDIETEAGNVISAKIGQARRMPLTTLLRAFSVMEEAQPYLDSDEMVDTTPARLSGRTVAEAVIDPQTGETLASKGAVVDRELAKRIREALGQAKILVRARRAGFETNQQILDYFGERVTVTRPKAQALVGKWSTEEILDPETRRPLVRAFSHIEEEAARSIAALGLESVEVFEVHPYISQTLLEDRMRDGETALLEVHKHLRPGDPPTLESARSLLYSYFFDVKRYDLGPVGRYKINLKLGTTVPPDIHTLTLADLLAIVEYFIALGNKEGDVDDIDHLQNKRVRSVGELLQNQLRGGFLRLERVARERMTSLDKDQVTPQAVISIKPITAAVRSFFGSGQLSQFMDQTNPLSELVHKRRVSVLGPGGLSRQSAKLEVRDVHHSHYGRICPIETPEGPNIGLIGSLSTYARVNDHGFIETPYREVRKGQVTDELKYLMADEDERCYIAPATAPLDERGRLRDERVTVRYGSFHPQVSTEEVEYMDVSAMQLFSPSTSMIPFLENDDANRALMGSNMQRQAVPLLRPDAPLVKTGIERRLAHDSGAIIVADVAGTIEEVDATRIRLRGHRDGDVYDYRLLTFLRSNQSTCIHQKPVVRVGQRVRKGELLADGTATDGGELALGRNLLVAFMIWEGYNYEDAIVISERVAREDLMTSIHIERYEIEARETKLGPEEITRDIPNVGDELLRNLDEHGIVQIGAEVNAEDILVGKVAPKTQGELTAEERLVIAIFGKKAEEMRDASLRVPHGEGGIVVDVKIFSRYKHFCRKCNREVDFVKESEQAVCPGCGRTLDRRPGDELKPGTNHLVRVYVAQRRKIREGDKIAGRHGNKGVIARILPEADMPHLPGGTPVDIILNPLGVPSRMNVGQILETHLGFVASELGFASVNPIFQGSREDEIMEGIAQVSDRWRKQELVKYATSELGLRLACDVEEDPLEEVVSQLHRALEKKTAEELEALAAYLGIRLEEWEEATEERARRELVAQRMCDNAFSRSGLVKLTGKCYLVDGCSGEFFNQPIAVGQVYMMKLAHLVEDKIHARSTGPYSLVTQQPLGGKAQFGGQRFGEMEVWALEAYGAAHTLQEILTIKSDDVQGRVRTYESIVKGESVLEPGVPESFKILVKELESLCLQVTLESADGQAMELREAEEEAGVSRSERSR